MRKRASLVFVLTLAALVSISGSSAAHGDDLAHAAHPAPRVVGGDAAERRALGEILDSLKISAGRVEIARGPMAATGYRGHRKTLMFRGPSDAESQWKDEVAAGVYLARGFQAAWVGIPGRGSGSFHVSWGGRPMAKRDLIPALRRAARTSGARINRIEFLKPFRLAPVVSITVADAAAFTRRGGLRMSWAYTRSHARLEGIFLIVRNKQGRVIARGGTAFRVGTGAGVWLGSDHGF
jgi:hypothetical protein